ncbi:MAG TPA: uracil phosphoribosyltransferase [Gemmatales bacterium]|nr:uracil phosphoribosyltransferase [Gemmatales bacterium]HMP61222.1 uracil phosphoribosyltransferase [Gemmatales bacterium]
MAAAAVHVSRHPLVLQRLANLRHKDTPTPEFRRMVRDLAQLIFYEATTDLALRSIEVPTPLASCQSHEFAERIGLIPILRAGLGMAEAILDLVPSAQVWHLGIYRDHETSQPVLYYNPLPERPNMDIAFVVDPMLATGGSALFSIAVLKKLGVRRIKFLGLIAAPEGITNMQREHPDVPLHLAAVDEGLNDQDYIVPGLGDAGDRQFGTGSS